MNYVGVDIHKKYSVLCALDERGRKLCEARVEGNSASGFARFFAGLEGPSKAVVEACWNWGLVHDELEELEQIDEVVLADPSKTRLIADAQIRKQERGSKPTIDTAGNVKRLHTDMLKLKDWATRIRGQMSDIRYQMSEGTKTSKAPIVTAPVGARVATGVINVVKGSSDYRDDWMSRHVHCTSVARKKRESRVCPGKHRRAEFAPRAADREFDDDSSASAIGIFHNNVKVTVVFHLNAHNAGGHCVFRAKK